MRMQATQQLSSPSIFNNSYACQNRPGWWACSLNPDLKFTTSWLWSWLCLWIIRGSCCMRFRRDKRKDQFLDQSLDLPHLPVTALTESSLVPFCTHIGSSVTPSKKRRSDRWSASESDAELKATQFNNLNHSRPINSRYGNITLRYISPQHRYLTILNGWSTSQAATVLPLSPSLQSTTFSLTRKSLFLGQVSTDPQLSDSLDCILSLKTEPVNPWFTRAVCITSARSTAISICHVLPVSWLNSAIKGRIHP